MMTSLKQTNQNLQLTYYCFSGKNINDIATKNNRKHNLGAALFSFVKTRITSLNEPIMIFTCKVKNSESCTDTKTGRTAPILQAQGRVR